MEMEHRRGFMLLGFFINPDEEPPLKLVRPNAPNLQNPCPNSSSDEFGTPLSPEVRRLLVSMGVAEDHTPVHFFTRTLFDSDVKKGLTRLAIPKSQLLRTFLTDQEEAFLQERDANRRIKRLQVDVVDPLGVVRILSLSRWNYKKSDDPNAHGRRSCSYALNGGWMDLVASNGLAAGDTIQVWSFRKTDASLGLVIFKEDKGSAASDLHQGTQGICSLSSSDSQHNNNYGSTPTWGLKRKRGSNSSLSTITTA